MKNKDKRLLKMNYLGKLNVGSLSEVQRFIDIIYNKKKFNKQVTLFKNNIIKVFENDKETFNNVCFVADKTSLDRLELLR